MATRLQILRCAAADFAAYDSALKGLMTASIGFGELLAAGLPGTAVTPDLARASDAMAAAMHRPETARLRLGSLGFDLTEFDRYLAHARAFVEASQRMKPKTAIVALPALRASRAIVITTSANLSRLFREWIETERAQHGAKV